MSDDPFEIPAFLDRRGEKKSPPTRKTNPEVEARREAHRIGDTASERQRAACRV